MNPTKLITARSSILTLLTEDEVEINRSIQNPETRHEEANSHKNKQEDIIIAVMGKKGCGKSSFISKLAVKDYTGAVGHDLNSEKHFIRKIECNVMRHRVLLINTPGFDDTAGEDVIVLERIAKWLHNSYNDKKFLSALIYMHDIGESRVGHSSVKSFKLFRKITGQENMNNVVLLTTKWDGLGENRICGVERESQLKMNSDFWKGMIADGAAFMRHDGTTESAGNVTSSLLGKMPVVLNMQKQMAGGSPLHETDAGAYINEELIRYQRETEEIIVQLKEEFGRTTRRNNSPQEIRLREHCDRKISELRKQQKRLLEIKFQEQENRPEERTAAKRREDYEEIQNRAAREELRIAKIIHRLDYATTTIATVVSLIHVVAPVTNTAIAKPVLFATVAAAVSNMAAAMIIAKNVIHVRAASISRGAEPARGLVVALG